MEPRTTHECIIKVVLHATVGQQQQRAHGVRKERDGAGADGTDAAGVALQTAQILFRAVGSSSSECDTIPGRQCMASVFFLAAKFDDVIIYLQSVKSYTSESLAS